MMQSCRVCQFEIETKSVLHLFNFYRVQNFVRGNASIKYIAVVDWRKCNREQWLFDRSGPPEQDDPRQRNKA